MRKTFILFLAIVLPLALVCSCATRGASSPVVLVHGLSATGFSTIQEAVDAAPASKSTIRLEADIVLEAQVTVADKEITLVASDSGATITRNFSCEGANRMFAVTGSGSLTIGGDGGGITIDGSASTKAQSSAERQVFACGLDAKDSAAALVLGSGVVVCNNSTDSNGSAVVCYGKLTIAGATVENCRASGAGGAIQLAGSGSLIMEGGLIQGNSASFGGAVNVIYPATVRMTGGTIRDNSAQVSGGNIYLGAKTVMAISGGSVEGGSISLANGTSSEKTTVSVSGKLDVEQVEVCGKNVSLKIDGAVDGTIGLCTTLNMTPADRIGLLSGSKADTQFGCFKWPDGTMYSDSENVRVRFFDGYFKATKQSLWGDCTYIEFPNGENMLVDIGSENTANMISKLLWAYGINEIDYFICTHYHSDHINGLKSLVNKARIKIGSFIATSYMPKTKYTWVTDILNANGIETAIWSQGTSATIGGVSFNVLWPIQSRVAEGPQSTSQDTNPYTFVPGNSTDMNNNSLVFTFKYGTTTILFAADIYKASEAELLSIYDASVLKCDILKVMHHAHGTSGSVEFIDACDPDITVAMTTLAPDDPEIPATYSSDGRLFLTTRAAGDVVVTIGSDGYSYETGKSSLTTK